MSNNHDNKSGKFQGIADRAREVLDSIESGKSRPKLVRGSADELTRFMELKIALREIGEKASTVGKEIAGAGMAVGKLKEMVLYREEFKAMNKELYLTIWELYDFEPMPGETIFEKRTREKAKKLKEARDDLKREQAAIGKDTNDKEKEKGGLLERLGQLLEDLEWGW